MILRPGSPPQLSSATSSRKALTSKRFHCASVFDIESFYTFTFFWPGFPKSFISTVPTGIWITSRLIRGALGTESAYVGSAAAVFHVDIISATANRGAAYEPYNTGAAAVTKASAAQPRKVGVKIMARRGFLCCIGIAGLAGLVAVRPAPVRPARSLDSRPPNSVLLDRFTEGFQAQPERFQYTQLHMGTQVRITLYAPDRDTAESAAEAAFKRFAELENIMSDYRPNSELMRLCDRAGGPAVPVSKELFFVLERAADLSRKSNGAFDVTVGPLIRLWRAARKSGRLPDPADIALAKPLVGWKKVTLNSRRRTVRLAKPGMKLDLGGIAKGYANDEAMKLIRARGVRSAMLESGGDILVSDPPPGRSAWKIEVANPGVGVEKKVFEVKNRAIATSGDTEQFVEIAGRRYSHVVDPKTGIGLTSRTAATVIAPTGILGDSLATAMCVLGKTKGERLAKKYRGVTAYIRQVK
jgi:FAD:protein FMN transferase